MHGHKNLQQFLIYLYSYMFRNRELVIGKRQNIFKKRIYKFNLLEMRSHFLHNMTTTSAFLFYTFKICLNVWKDKKIKFIRLLKLEVGDVSEIYGVVKYHVLFCCVLVSDGCVVFS